MKHVMVKESIDDLLRKCDELTKSMFKALIDETSLDNMSEKEIKLIANSFDLMSVCKKTYGEIADAIDCQTIMLEEVLEKLKKLEDK